MPWTPAPTVTSMPFSQQTPPPQQWATSTDSEPCLELKDNLNSDPSPFGENRLPQFRRLVTPSITHTQYRRTKCAVERGILHLFLPWVAGLRWHLEMERVAQGRGDTQPPGGLGPPFPALGQSFDPEITRLESCLPHFLAVWSQPFLLMLLNFRIFLLKLELMSPAWSQCENKNTLRVQSSSL